MTRAETLASLVAWLVILCGGAAIWLVDLFVRLVS